MKLQRLHDWDLTPKQAITVQQHLRTQVVAEDRLPTIRRVAGVDVGFEDDGRITRAAVAVLNFPDLVLVEQAIAQRPTTFPYVPGLLSFREIPAVLDALTRLRQFPDLIIADGQGLAHPRRFGLACHLGLVTDTPCIGAAKSRLIGTHDEPGEEKGAWAPLMDAGELIGAVLRARTRVRPLYISIGHRVSLPTAIDLVLACTTRYRLPETTRWAHRLASG